ncbi:MAG TPA: hypothetical protein VN724_01900 [Pyrinomonadaceae bacterium]|nr:hypothetical protein [Pyrinomonadaceae bacterium]
MAGTEKPQGSETPTLKNAWIRKDAEGDYFLYIRTENGSGAMINLTAANPSLDEQIKNEINPERGKSDFIKELFESWLAEQDRSLIKVEKSEDSEPLVDDFPEVIEADA